LRKQVLIDYSKVIELDFSSYHLNLLYALEGIVPPHGDLYTIPGFEHLRPYVKKSMLIIFNTRGKRAAYEAIRKEVPRGELEDWEI
jgi:hypothetical protein